LWAEIANCRHEYFCSTILRVASVESTIYENLVEIKVKDTPLLTCLLGVAITFVLLVVVVPGSEVVIRMLELDIQLLVNDTSTECRKFPPGHSPAMDNFPPHLAHFTPLLKRKLENWQ